MYDIPHIHTYHIHTYTHTCIHTYTHTYIHTYIHTHHIPHTTQSLLLTYTHTHTHLQGNADMIRMMLAANANPLLLNNQGFGAHSLAFFSEHADQAR
jgi:hypothetical protein